MVNAAHHVITCSDDWHDAARRQHSMYCIHCGVQLINLARLRM
jgi:hypothetical protein